MTPATSRGETPGNGRPSSCCPFCQRPGPPCRGAAKAECAERERGWCCRRRIGIGTEVVSPYGPGTVTGRSRRLLDGWTVLQVEVPRIVLDGLVPDPAPFQVAICPSDAWVAAYPGPQHAYAWYPLNRLHRPGCWQLPGEAAA